MVPAARLPGLSRAPARRGARVAPFRRVLPTALLAVVATIATVACGDRPATDAEGPHADIVRKVVPRLEAQLGMPFRTPPRLERRTREEVRAFVAAQLASERARAQLAGQQAVYRRLGLIPDTLDLEALLLRLLEEQIIGYYDPATKVLYVVDGAPKALLEQTIAHELVHALQDQYVAIDSIQAATGDADRQVAAQAVLEGQAVFEQLRADQSAGTMLNMPGGWDRIRDMIRDNQGGMPVFASAPRVVREGLLFPYLGGADFVRRFLLKRPAKELLGDLPVSTKQILNDAAYFTDTPAQRDAPTTVTLPAPRTGTVTYSNTVGEFETRLILVQHLKDEVVARQAAGGVDGDRVAVIATPSGDALVWASVWDSPVDAVDFFGRLGDLVKRRYLDARPVGVPGETLQRWDADPTPKRREARTVTVRLLQVAGRPVVVYTDVPRGVSDALVDPARITLAD